MFVFNVFCASKKQDVEFSPQKRDFIGKNSVNKVRINSNLSAWKIKIFKIEGCWFDSSVIVIIF